MNLIGTVLKAIGNKLSGQEVGFEKVELTPPHIVDVTSELVKDLNGGIVEYSTQIEGDVELAECFMYNKIMNSAKSLYEKRAKKIKERMDAGETIVHSQLSASTSPSERSKFDWEECRKELTAKFPEALEVFNKHLGVTKSNSLHITRK